MASGDITSAQIGATLPLAYGPVRATGQKLLDYTAPDTTVYQAYALAEGEWDGCNCFFFDNQVYSEIYAGAGVFTAESQFQLNTDLGGALSVRFHSGTDTPLGSSFDPTYASTGLEVDQFNAVSNQTLDQLWNYIPAVVNPLMYTRKAYYFLTFKPTSKSTSSSLTPVGDWRSTRCRIFDANGNQTKYGYTLNPAWHFVDSWLRRVIKPEFGISLLGGAEALTATEIACFDWEPIVEAANYFDELINPTITSAGTPRFQGAYAFASTTTLAAIHEQILLCCRSFQREYGGKISLHCDKPRPATFFLDERHLMPGTLTADQKDVHTAANRYIGKFLDLNIPVIAKIDTIQRMAQSADGTYPVTMRTMQQSPCAAGDVFEIEDCYPNDFNGIYGVTSITGLNVAATFVGQLPAGVGAGNGSGGSIGYAQTRFSARTPEINHRQAQLAAGQLIASVAENATRLSKNKVELDFANCTYDQQNRLLKYEMIRDLGSDTAPWKPPINLTLTAYSESVDDFGNILKAQLDGDRIHVSDRVSWEFAGDYEIIQTTRNFFNWSQQADGTASAGQDSGTIQLVLKPYEETRFTDVSDAPTASFATLPGDTLWAGNGPVNSNYQVAYTSLTAADAGSSITVSVVGLQIRLGGNAPTIYDDSSIANLPYSTTLYIYVKDPAAVGGSIPIQSTTNPGYLTSQAGVMFVGEVTTPAGGGGSTGGSGGGGGGLPNPGSGSGGGGGNGNRTEARPAFPSSE